MPSQHSANPVGSAAVTHGIRNLVLPENQRRTLEELTSDLDLRVGDVRAKHTAFWTMLVLSAVIASAGVLTDSTATVIGAMIIAPLSTPIMGIALGIAKRERIGSALFAAAGAMLVVLVGLVFSLLLPTSYDLLKNSQIAGRTSPGLMDMIAATATGLAGAVALARRDVAAVLPGVAIAISLVPPLAVAGVCLGKGDPTLAFGATVLFVSNLLALVLAGTLVFTVLGYAEDAIGPTRRSRRRAYTVLSVLLTLVLVPLAANTAVNFALANYTARAKQVADEWIQQSPDASVTDVRNHGLSITINVRTRRELPPIATLLDELDGEVPDIIGITVESTLGEKIEVRPAGGG